jgi:hypothetical protein
MNADDPAAKLVPDGSLNEKLGVEPNVTVAVEETVKYRSGDRVAPIVSGVRFMEAGDGTLDGSDVESATETEPVLPSEVAGSEMVAV